MCIAEPCTRLMLVTGKPQEPEREPKSTSSQSFSFSLSALS